MRASNDEKSEEVNMLTNIRSKARDHHLVFTQYLFVTSTIISLDMYVSC
jgi:hypothetical protein